MTESKDPGEDYKQEVKMIRQVLGDLVTMAAEAKRAEEALRSYTAELESRNAELSEFAWAVAHAVKSPLVPLLGHARLLQEEVSALTPEGIQQRLEIIVSSGRRTKRIVDALHLFATAGHYQVKFACVDMAAAVAEARERISYLAAAPQTKITVPATWPAAWGYAPWVEEVWANYLSNGLKYGGTPPRLELGASRQADGMVRFWVRDNGPGLNPTEQGRLFQPFTCLQPDRAEGTGLGLALVKRLVEKQGGQVEVTSQPGQGSTFSFTLPGQARPHGR